MRPVWILATFALLLLVSCSGGGAGATVTPTATNETPSASATSTSPSQTPTQAAIATPTKTPLAVPMAAPVEGPKDQGVVWKWQSDRFSGFLWVKADDKAVVVSDSGQQQSGDFTLEAGRVTLLDATSGIERWHVDTPSQAYPTAMDDEAVYAGTADGTVFAWDRATGAERWRQSFPGVPATVVRTGDWLVVADDDPAAWSVGALSGTDRFADTSKLSGEVWGLDPATGTVLWKKTFGTGTTFVATGGDTLVVAAPGDGANGTVARLDPGTGEPTWSVDLSLTSRPAIGDGMVVAPGKQLVALDLETGEQRWAVPSSDDGRFFTPAFTGEYIEVATTNDQSRTANP